MKIFYDHLINISDIITEIDHLEITTNEKEDLANLVDATIHHQVMTVILNHLPEVHHQEFLERFQAKPHDPTLLDYLKARVENIEDKLAAAGQTVGEKIKQLLS